MLKHGADPNCQPDFFDAILRSGEIEILQALLEAGADPKTTFKEYSQNPDHNNEYEVPVLDLAVVTGNKPAVDLLIKYGASFDETCYDRDMYDGRAVHTRSFPLKKRDYGGIAMESYIHRYGWAGPSFWSSTQLDYRC